MQTSFEVTQIALNGAARVRQGETPMLKNPRSLSKLEAQQNIDFFVEGFQELQARDNADGEASIHIFQAGRDENEAVGKIQVGPLEAELEGDTRQGIRISVEDRGDVQKIKAYRFEESAVVVYEATVKPGNEMTSNVLLLDRENPEKSLIGSGCSDWLLSL